MPTLLARNADVLVTMDGQRRALKHAGLCAEDGIIKQVGPTAELPSTADTVIDLTGLRQAVLYCLSFCVSTGDIHAAARAHRAVSSTPSSVKRSAA
jgi:hypothetical protein